MPDDARTVQGAARARWCKSAASRRLNIAPELAFKTSVRPNRDSILAYSRILGWCLAAGLAVFVGAAAVQASAYLQRQQTYGLAQKRIFLDKVRACRRQAASPRPSWQDCEIRVRAQE